MHSRTNVIVIILGITAIIVLAIWSGISSLWMIWELLPGDTTRLTLDTSSPVIQTLEASSGFKPAIGLLPALPNDSYRQVGISQTPDGVVLVVWPRLLAQHQISDTLTQEGYRVERIGFILRASPSRIQTALPTFQRASEAIFKDIFAFHQPLEPNFIAAYKDGVVPHLTAVGVNRDSSLNITVRLDSDALPASAKKNLTSLDNFDSNEDAFIYLPSEALATIPVKVKSSWDELLRDKLSITKTRPALLEDLKSFSFVGIALAGDKTALGIEGSSTEFLNIATQWLSKEDQYQHVVTRAFRLPDRTLGYQRVPGEKRQIFSTSTQENGCLQSQIAEYPWWLCAQGSRSSLGTSQAAALSLVAESHSPWRLRLGSAYLANLNIPQIQSVYLQGNDQQALITINFKPKK